MDWGEGGEWMVAVKRAIGQNDSSQVFKLKGNLYAKE